MDNYELRFPKKRLLITSSIVVIVLGLLLAFITLNLNDRWYQREVIDVTERYISVHYELVKLIETGSTLMTGYEAYLKVNGTLSTEESEAFLNHLTAKEMSYIKNIAILKDTTIVHNFPTVGNESSLGVDLAKVENQRDLVLQTKVTGKGVVVGPVDLVQGGVGYIIRQPIEDADGNYWGQVSIVLKAEVINAAIDVNKNEAGLEIAIYEDDSTQKLIYGDPSVLENRPLIFDFNSDINQWVVYVVPDNGWEKYALSNVFITFIGLLVIVGLTGGLYYVQTINFNLQNALAHDHLTGLYNRNYLERVQKEVLNKAKENNDSFGLMHIDLDYFKMINDGYGHEAGDKVLVETARILQLVTRKNELVFRIGGDEFLLMMPFVGSRKELEESRQRLKEEFMLLYALTQYKVDIGPSIGAGLYPDDGESFDEVLRSADLRMYEEKGATR